MRTFGATNGSEPIRGFGDWETHGKPASKKHWAECRSAMSLAQAWCDRGVPSVPEKAASRLKTLVPQEAWERNDTTAWVERVVRFDDFGKAGSGAHLDLTVHLPSVPGGAVVAVEAKADEPFGATLEGKLREAAARLLRKKRTNIPARVHRLLCELLDPGHVRRTDLHNLRSQLLTATAGTLALAKEHGCRRAVLLIHEFRSDELERCPKKHRTKPNKIAVNARDLDFFLQLLPKLDRERTIGDGWPLGPFRLPGHDGIDFHVAKLVTPLS